MWSDGEGRPPRGRPGGDVTPVRAWEARGGGGGGGGGGAAREDEVASPSEGVGQAAPVKRNYEVWSEGQRGRRRQYEREEVVVEEVEVWRGELASLRQQQELLQERMLALAT